MCTAARGFQGLSIWRCDEHLCSGWRHCAWHSWSSLAEHEGSERRATREDSTLRPALLGLICTSLVLSAAPCSAQGPPGVFLEDYTWQELRDAIAAGATTVLVFSGSVEESGPHLALGKHNFRARVYAERIARALDHTLVAPIIPAAPTGDALRRFPGTIHVRPEIFAAYNADIVRSLAAAGFKYVFLLGRPWR